MYGVVGTVEDAINVAKEKNFLEAGDKILVVDKDSFKIVTL